ncbi:hypothetical protein SCLARK_001302 [Spiroplasma clarkii]|uniref:Eco57I restriction-modification methylase domain-containing protein n=1 Tax=Spiroplasma clarkii TaxID=2139 RepID=UPI000B5808A5|nr:N-6 DNA methylase [Spiroplasma clarkii]ARU91838.1 hypothetical protein SCLARK_001302 [Spiroplasma clarkii]
MGKMAKKTGEVYTPITIVKNILDLTGYKGKSIINKHIIDNSCGEGAFLIEIVRRYVRVAVNAGYTDGEIKDDLQEYIHGIELNKKSYNQTIKNLNNLIEELELNIKVKWDVLNKDALKVSKFDGLMDFVVGNPPYIRVHSLDIDYKQYDFAKNGMTDLYLIFFEIGIKMLKQPGKLAYITPNSYFTSDAGKNLRKFLVDKIWLKRY